MWHCGSDIKGRYRVDRVEADISADYERLNAFVIKRGRRLVESFYRVADAAAADAARAKS